MKVDYEKWKRSVNYRTVVTQSLHEAVEHHASEDDEPLVFQIGDTFRRFIIYPKARPIVYLQ